MSDKFFDLAYCGIYCPECSFKVAFESKRREHLANMPSKYDSFKDSDLADCDCSGCKRQNVGGECRIKDCAVSRDLDHCGLCQDFPCEQLSAFADDGIPHHQKAVENLSFIKNNGIAEFFEKMETAALCSCGEQLSWYVKNCISCGKIKTE